MRHGRPGVTLPCVGCVSVQDDVPGVTNHGIVALTLTFVACVLTALYLKWMHRRCVRMPVLPWGSVCMQVRY